ncbi:MAG: endo-1,4-beta-xylanase [Lachnospiraceae bacterium]|nr:endo-1,4-beta-xylanase [Lachnospiraceae bacterium]
MVGKNAWISCICMAAVILLAMTGCEKNLPSDETAPAVPEASSEVLQEDAQKADEEPAEASDVPESQKEMPEEEKDDPAEQVTHIEDAPLIEQDILDLRSIVASKDGLGEETIVGACVGSAGAADPNLMGLVFKHFNAVTLENELKMDAMFNYSNDLPEKGSIHEEELNGEKIMVPVLNFSRADAILDRIAAWNDQNPEKKIRVRGHVLIWHSQAPEWFFHEDYDPSKGYVSKEVMDKRQEWYIKSILTYYTAADSRYNGLFYGWDVVNEAVSDAGSYRRDTEPGNDSLSDPIHSSKSSWWKVYGSNEFIINAFRYANKYAPADLRLYYNDYNDTDPVKVRSIVTLLEDVKNAEGTRIDGFGMQGHYTVNVPTAGKIEDAVRAYSKVVDEVMLTELDVKASGAFDGSAEKLPAEYEKQAAYYGSIYELMKKLNAEEGINVSGLTVWGVTDAYSWLRQANSVGGASDGKVMQHPLLFDKSYKAKPSFWAIADPSRVNMGAAEVKRPEVTIQRGSVTIDAEEDDAWKGVEEIPLDIVVGKSNAKCKARLLWDDEDLYVYMDVSDKILNDASEDDYQQDSVEIFIDENNSRLEAYDSDDRQFRINFNDKHSFNGEKAVEENVRSKVKRTEEGYIVEAAFRWTEGSPKPGMKIGLELQVNDATDKGERSGTISWADDTGTCYLDPSMFGHAVLSE